MAEESARAASIGQEDQNVYEAVLDGWLGSESQAQLVNERLSPAPSASDLEYKECTRRIKLKLAPANSEPAASLNGVKFKNPGIRLVDGEEWSADDGELEESVAHGSFKPSSLDRAFAHSLITFSQVAFSEDGRDALVKFSNVCGRLCGTGSTLRMHKAAGRWKVVKRCGGWIS